MLYFISMFQNIQQIGDHVDDVAIFLNNLVLFQTSEALQAHLQNAVGLSFAQVIQAVISAAVHRIQPIGTVIILMGGLVLSIKRI